MKLSKVRTHIHLELLDWSSNMPMSDSDYKLLLYYL